MDKVQHSDTRDLRALLSVPKPKNLKTRTTRGRCGRLALMEASIICPVSTSCWAIDVTNIHEKCIATSHLLLCLLVLDHAKFASIIVSDPGARGDTGEPGR